MNELNMNVQMTLGVEKQHFLALKIFQRIQREIKQAQRSVTVSIPNLRGASSLQTLYLGNEKENMQDILLKFSMHSCLNDVAAFREDLSSCIMESVPSLLYAL
jgi:hypothetical protein